MREELRGIARRAIESVLPDRAVREELSRREISDPVRILAFGKASWRMARAAVEVLGKRVKGGIAITKRGHSQGPIEGIEVWEASHPVPDESSVSATRRALELMEGLSEGETVLLLISGGGSALFELPAEGVSLEEIREVTEALLRGGATIGELNAVRKRLSAVKGGRLGEMLRPARVLALVLSDVVGDRLDTIASGPAHPDGTTAEEALRIASRYGLKLSPAALEALRRETPKRLEHVETVVVGNLLKACATAMEEASRLGYSPFSLTTHLEGEAREVGLLFASAAKSALAGSSSLRRPCALVAGGETVVRVRGKGRGGRNQELALSFALSVEGLEGVALLSLGTDGTDGPTDAAGAVVDGGTARRIREAGLDPQALLEDNDSYRALQAAGDLLFTGPTGTNVNDVVVLLVR